MPDNSASVATVQRIDDRLRSTEQRLAAELAVVEQRRAHLDQKFESIDERFDRLQKSLDGQREDIGRIGETVADAVRFARFGRMTIAGILAIGTGVAVVTGWASDVAAWFQSMGPRQ